MNNNAILERLLETPEAQKILAAERAKTLATRKKLAAELKAIREAPGMAALVANVEKAKAGVAKVNQALREAGELLRQAETAQRNETSRIDREQHRLERELSAIAPDSIHQFVVEMDREFERTRQGEIISCNIYSEFLTFARQPIVEGVKTNLPSISRRLEAIRAAITTAEALRFEPLDDEEIDVRLQRLRDGLPAVVDEVQKVA